MHQTDDQALVLLATQGDPASYGDLFERYQSKIFNYAYSLCGHREDAADIAQDAFVKVFEALPRMADKQLDFAAYLYRTAHNCAMDTLRARGRVSGPEPLDWQEDPSVYADPERAALLSEQHTHVRKAAGALSDDFRAVLALRELHDLSYDQIAEVLGKPRNTVGVYLSRARLKMRGEFRMSYVDVEKLAAECQEMLPLLSAFIDDELTPEERTRVEAHLEACPLCRLALEQMTESSKSYRALIPLIPPLGLKESVLSRVSGLQGGTTAPDAPQVPGEGAASQAAADAGGDDAGGRGGGDDAGGRGGGEDSGAQPSAGPRGLRALDDLPPGAIAAIVVVVALLGALGGTLLASMAGRRPATPLSPFASVAAMRAVTEATEAVPPPPPGDEGEGGSGQPPAPEETRVDPRPPARDDDPPPRPSQLSPSDQYQVPSSQPEVALEWSAVSDPSGVSYRVEIESYSGGWSDIEAPVQTGVTTIYHYVGTEQQRWRVWAVDGEGNASGKTGWRYISVYAPDEGVVMNPEGQADPIY